MSSDMPEPGEISVIGDCLSVLVLAFQHESTRVVCHTRLSHMVFFFIQNACQLPVESLCKCVDLYIGVCPE